MSAHNAQRRVAIYSRVSTKEQNLDTQLVPLRAYTDRAGWTVHREYSDFGYSGQRQSRPGLDALVADANARRFDVVLVTKLDRLGRSLLHLLKLLNQLRELGIDFVATDQAIDTTTSTGKLMLNILGSISEFERELIRERVMAGLERARREGKILGRPPKVDVDEIQALKQQGKSLREIGKALGLSKSAVAYHIRKNQGAQPA